MTTDYLRAVQVHLSRLSRSDRRRALDALAAQLDELAELGTDPAALLGAPADYARELTDALEGGAHGTSGSGGAEEGGGASPRWRVLGIPVETRGPLDARIRARIWDPADPRAVVPRLFGAGWTLNLGALAVRAGLLRPDDADADVLSAIPGRDLAAATAAPLVLSAATAAALAAQWSALPHSVASGFTLTGRARGRAPRWSLLVGAALGLAPALWAQPRRGGAEDRLVRAGGATFLAATSASLVAAVVLDARRPGRRWGLLGTAALPLSLAGALAVIVVPLRSGLHRTWRRAGVSPWAPVPASPPSLPPTGASAPSAHLDAPDPTGSSPEESP